MQVLMLATVVSLAILPISRPKHPRTSVVSRGPEELRVTTLEAYPAALAEAKQRSVGQRRVVVLPFVAKGDDSRLLSPSFQMELIRDLQHLSDVITVDLFTFRHAFPAGAAGAHDARRAAKSVAAEIVVSGTVEVTGDQLVTTVHSSAVEQPAKPVVITVRSTPADFFDVSNQITSGLLAEWKISPSDAQKQSMFASPTAVDAARMHCDRAIMTLIEWNTNDAQSDAQGKLEEAAQDAEAAIKADPNYLRAYLAAASIAEARQSDTQRNRFLRAGRNRIRPATSLEQRTVLELQADYALFVQNDRIAARQKYAEILKLCPNDALALWRGVELIGEQNEGQSLSADDYQQAARYAARLQSTHPHSPLTKLLAGSK
jgi:TolB-like protein